MSEELEQSGSSASQEAQTPAPDTTEVSSEAKQERKSGSLFGDHAEAPLRSLLRAKLTEIQGREKGESKPEAAAEETSEASETTEASEEKTDQPEADATPETAKEGHPEQSIKAPQAWSADDKSEWGSIPPKMQQVIADREREAHAKITRQGQEIAKWRPVIEKIQSSKYSNMEPTKLLGQIFDAQLYLDRDKKAAVKWIADSYGVDLKELAGVTSQPSGDDQFDDLFRDPRFDQVSQTLSETQEELKQARAEIQRLGGYVNTQQQQQAQQTEAQQKAAIEKFAKDKPYFNDLQAEIADEVAFLRSKSPEMALDEVLAKAYQRAVNNSDTIREKMAAEKREKERTEAEKKLHRAKSTRQTNVKSQVPGEGRKVGSAWNDRDAMRRIVERMNAS